MKKSEKKIGIQSKPVFLARTAELLTEGYTFSQAVYLILPHHTTHYEALNAEIEQLFKKGLGATPVLQRLGFSESVLLSTMIAEKNGHLAEVFISLAAQLESIEKAKKKFRNLLAYPMTLFVFISGLLMLFRQFFLPNMRSLSVNRQAEGFAFSDRLPNLVAMLPDLMIGGAILITLIIGLALYYYRGRSPERKISFIKQLPMINTWIFQWKSQHFARELGSLLDSGISMQDALDVLIEQRVDPLLGEIAARIKEHLIYGEPFHAAVALTDGLTKEFSSFAKHGEASGHLAKELLIYSKHLEETIERKTMKGLSLLQPILFSLIALCIMAAYIALLLPVYNMLDTI